MMDGRTGKEISRGEIIAAVMLDMDQDRKLEGMNTVALNYCDAVRSKNIDLIEFWEHEMINFMEAIRLSTIRNNQ